MALSKGQLIIAGRVAAFLAGAALRGRARALSWAAHDFLWLYPTLRRNCSWHGEVATRFETERKEVWLTIDDGPDPRDTPGMLEVLARFGARATFFFIGSKIEAQRPLVRQALAEGHTLGNHTYSHPSALWWILPRYFVNREIALGAGAIRAATGLQSMLFRNPVGMCNEWVHPHLQRAGMRLVGWSADGSDGCRAAPSQIVSRILPSVSPGAIILLHESGRSRHRVLTLARLLDHLTTEGYRFVIPSETALR